MNLATFATMMFHGDRAKGIMLICMTQSAFVDAGKALVRALFT
jgi:hypothetical protein